MASSGRPEKQAPPEIVNIYIFKFKYHSYLYHVRFKILNNFKLFYVSVLWRTRSEKIHIKVSSTFSIVGRDENM